jgi:geranylgeranyl transferase type-2 subunit beta
MEEELLIPLHVKYIQCLDKRQDELEYWLTEHLRLNGIYWGLTALDLMNHIDALPREEVISYVKSLQQSSGGFSAHTGHDTHITCTLSAVQVLITLDALEVIDVDKVINCKYNETLVICKLNFILRHSVFTKSRWFISR